MYSESVVGVQSGTTFTEPLEDGADIGNILGYALFSGGQVGTNILDNIGNGAGAIGFDGTLPAGDYIFALQQLSGPTDYELTFNLTDDNGGPGVGPTVFNLFNEDGTPAFATSGIAGVPAVGDSRAGAFLVTLTEADASITLSVFDDGPNKGVEAITVDIVNGEVYELDAVASSVNLTLSEDTLDFEASGDEVFEVGEIVTDQFDGLTIGVGGELEAMIFDTSKPTGGDDGTADVDKMNVLLAGSGAITEIIVGEDSAIAQDTTAWHHRLVAILPTLRIRSKRCGYHVLAPLLFTGLHIVRRLSDLIQSEQNWMLRRIKPQYIL